MAQSGSLKQSIVDESLEDSLLATFFAKRALTYDLLDSLSDDDMALQSAQLCGMLGQQFHRLGQAQDHRIQALRTGQLSADNSALILPFEKDQSVAALIAYLKALDDLLEEELLNIKFNKVSWFGDEAAVAEYLQSLSEHEILHHGQWIVQFAQFERPLPQSWDVLNV